MFGKYCVQLFFLSDPPDCMVNVAITVEGARKHCTGDDDETALKQYFFA